MKIMNMRWGCDSCPASDTFIADVMAHDDEGNLVFVLVSQFMEYEYTMVSSLPMFDISMNLLNSEINTDKAWKMLKDHAIEHYDYELSNLPEELYSTPYANVIRLARFVAHEACTCGDLDTTDVNKVFEKYIDEDISEMEIPDFDADDEYMEGDC